MNVGELLEALEGVDPETKIRIAFQPGYPLRATVATTATPDEVLNVLEIDPDDEEDDNPEEARFFWIMASDSAGWDENPYASKNLWDA